MCDFDLMISRPHVALKRISMNIRRMLFVTFLSSLIGATVSTAQAPIEERLVARWINTYNTGDAQQMGAMYTRDARLSHGHCEAVEGRAAIAEFWRMDLSVGEFSTQLRVDDRLVLEDTVYISGKYLVLDETGNSQPFSGSYTQIWRREQADWAIFRESWMNLACVKIRNSAPSQEETIQARQTTNDDSRGLLTKS